MIDLKEQREWAQKWADKGYVKIGVCPKAIVEMLDMIEAASLDAARYQWLRGQPYESKSMVICTSVWANGTSEHGDEVRGESMDASIDAAMAATKGEEA